MVSIIVDALIAAIDSCAKHLTSEDYTKLKLEITQRITERQQDVAADEAEENRILKEGP